MNIEQKSSCRTPQTVVKVQGELKAKLWGTSSNKEETAPPQETAGTTFPRANKDIATKRDLAKLASKSGRNGDI